MTPVEQLLQDTFAAKSGTVPAAEDLTSAVASRVARAHRRIAALLAVTSMVLVGGGVAVATQFPGGVSSTQRLVEPPAASPGATSAGPCTASATAEGQTVSLAPGIRTARSLTVHVGAVLRIAVSSACPAQSVLRQLVSHLFSGQLPTLRAVAAGVTSLQLGFTTDPTRYLALTVSVLQQPVSSPYRSCMAHVSGNRLTAPFWIDNDHFNPTNVTPRHTAAAVLRAYETDRTTRGLSTGTAESVFFAAHSRTDINVPTENIWVVLTYNTYGVPPLGPSGGPPQLIDRTALISDRTLRSLSVIEARPDRCS